jgi:hypothetical protein
MTVGLFDSVDCDIGMTLFGFGVTLLRFHVTPGVTLRRYAKQKRMGGRAAAGVKQWF